MKKPLNIFCLVVIVLFGIIMIINLFFSYRYVAVEDWGIFFKYILMANIPLFASLIYLYFEKKLDDFKRFFVIAIICFTIPFSGVRALFFGINGAVMSQTQNVNAYMRLDNLVDEDIVDIKIFPDSIPETASEIKYFYRYRYSFDYDYDIFLECKLATDDYEAEKERITLLYPDIQKVKSDTDEGFIDYRLEYTNIQNIYSDYYFVFVSFSDSNLTVRYNISYAIGGIEGVTIPHFIEHAKLYSISF